MQQSNSRHCYLCGLSHNGACNPNSFDYFQCTECQTLQQLPKDVCGFGGIDGYFCFCNKSGAEVWKQISFQEYMKLSGVNLSNG